MNLSNQNKTMTGKGANSKISKQKLQCLGACMLVLFICAVCILLDHLWRGYVIKSVQNAKATADGLTVAQVLSEKYALSDGDGIQWQVEIGIGLYLDARVTCRISLGDYPKPIIHAWQWDYRWAPPRTLALTPSTVELCPELDPHELDPNLVLTSDGRTTLWPGKFKGNKGPASKQTP